VARKTLNHSTATAARNHSSNLKTENEIRGIGHIIISPGQDYKRKRYAFEKGGTGVITRFFI